VVYLEGRYQGRVFREGTRWHHSYPDITGYRTRHDAIDALYAAVKKTAGRVEDIATALDRHHNPSSSLSGRRVFTTSGRTGQLTGFRDSKGSLHVEFDDGAKYAVPAHHMDWDEAPQVQQAEEYPGGMDEGDSCEECGEPVDGDGYDGLCGNCADRADQEGRWGPPSADPDAELFTIAGQPACGEPVDGGRCGRAPGHAGHPHIKEPGTEVCGEYYVMPHGFTAPASRPAARFPYIGPDAADAFDRALSWARKWARKYVKTSYDLWHADPEPTFIVQVMADGQLIWHRR
jgi:hypothetical protein